MKVLVIDDSIVYRSAIKQALQNNKITEITTASNGKIGADFAKAGNFDIITVDLEMPVMDGCTAVRIMRTRGYDRCVIALTANTSDEDKKMCFDAGYSDFACKPVVKEDLLNLVEKHLSP